VRISWSPNSPAKSVTAIVLAAEAVVADHLAAGRQRAVLRRDALDWRPSSISSASSAVRAARYSWLSLGNRTGLSRASSAVGISVPVSASAG